MSEKITAGIVLFNPDLEKLNSIITSLKKQLKFIYLIDNASKNISEIEKLCRNESSDEFGISLIKNNENKGIAAALNRIMKQASSDEYEWVLTLDHDSIPPDNLLSELEKYVELDNVGIVAPRILDINTNKFLHNEGEEENNESNDYQLIKKCITSGSLVSTKAWLQVGKYDEYLFIDYVDFDFCIRMRKNGFKIVQANKIVMKHELGKMSIKRLLFKNVSVMNHNAMRKYYMIRNRIYCEYKYHNRFGFNNFVYIIKSIILIMLYEDNKGKKLKAVLKGASDGVKDSKKIKIRKNK